MKKKILIIFMFILAFMFMPIVRAEEIPREGVTYFLQYPDGSEDVTESYDEAVQYPEKVVFEGVTDSNGQVTIEGLGDTGEVRIVQEVPDGYTTTEKEIKVDLSQKKSVEITNKARFTKAVKDVITNPKTGMSFLLFVFVIGLTIYTIKTRKNRNLLVLVPVLLGIALVSNVKATNDDFTITVKDDSGNGLANVPVKVYTKPVIDASPAIKYDANGGKFFDGQTIMYERIPYNDCSWDDFYDSLSENDYRYILDNTYYNAHREGYYRDGKDEPETLSNGTVIKNYWEQDSDAHVLTIHANGEPFDYYGHNIDVISYYYDDFMGLSSWDNKIDFDYLNENRSINGKYFGFSTNTSCENVPIGVNSKYRLTSLNYPSDVYMCYGDKQDGVYIDENYSRGNIDSCLIESDLRYYNEEGIEIMYIVHGTYLNINATESNMMFNPYYKPDSVNKFEIVQNGKTLVSINNNEILYNNNSGYLSFDNIEKERIVKNYFDEILDKHRNATCPSTCDYIECK